MIYIPPTNSIHLHNFNSGDPLSDLKTNLNDFQNDLDNARGFFYGDYKPQSQQTAQEWYKKAATLLLQIEQLALPSTMQGGVWQNIQNQWDTDVANQIHDNLYDVNPSLDTSMSNMSTAINQNYPPSSSDSTVQEPAKWIESLVSNVQCLINTGQLPGD